MAKFKFHLSIGVVGCRKETTFEIPNEDLEGLTGADRDKVIDEYARDELWEQIEWGAYEIDENGKPIEE